MRQARRLCSVPRALHARRASVGLSTEGLEAHPVTLRAYACQYQKPGADSGPGDPGGHPCSGGRDVLPPRGYVACQHSRGRSWEGSVSSSELPGAERGMAKRHTDGDRATNLSCHCPLCGHRSGE